MTTNQQEYNPVEQYPQRFRMLGLAPFLSSALSSLPGSIFNFLPGLFPRTPNKHLRWDPNRAPPLLLPRCPTCCHILSQFLPLSIIGLPSSQPLKPKTLVTALSPLSSPLPFLSSAYFCIFVSFLYKVPFSRTLS